MQTIYLDISNRGVIPVVYAKQNDVGRKVEVVLTNSGLPYEPEAGSAFSAWYSGASGVGNYTDIGDHSAFSVSGNKVTVELITQMLQNAGEGILCMVLSRANGDQIGLWNIRYICEGVPGAGSEPAKDYYTAFSQAVAGLPYPDVSLSAPGKAADAAAVGTALAGKAPAGYGLGLTSGAYVDDCNMATAFGLYSFSYATENNPLNAYGSLLVLPHNDTEKCQILNSSYNKSILIRYETGGVWGEWEWVNPPMVLGVEYRTTKRHNGKPVYTQAISFGALPNASEKLVSYCSNSGTVGGVLRVYGYTSSGVTLPYNSSYASYNLYGSTTAVGVETNANKSDQTAVVIVEYCLA